MKKSIFAMMAFVLVALLAGCKKESDSEIKLSVSEITDSTVVINCEYAPQKSVRYLVTFEGSSMAFDKSRPVSFCNLTPGTKYSFVATAQDADNNEVEHKVLEFMTTGVPDNKRPPMPTFMIYDEFEADVVDTLPTEVSIITSCNYEEYVPYVISVENASSSSSKYKQQSLEIATAAQTATIFTGLESGCSYNVHINATGLPSNAALISFTKK